MLGSLCARLNSLNLSAGLLYHTLREKRKREFPGAPPKFPLDICPVFL